MKVKINAASRIFTTAVLILIQASLIADLLVSFVNWGPAVTFILGVLNIVIVLHLIRKNDQAGYKIVWILVVVLLPAVGGLLYLMYGTKLPAKSLQLALDKEHQATLNYLKQDTTVYNNIKATDNRAASMVTYLNNITHYPAYANTATKYYPMGEDMYEDMLAELGQAKHFIFMEYFIIEDGKMWQGILNILEEKASAGVDVRLLYDDAGCIALLHSKFAKQMQAKGIKCVPFNKVVPFLALRMNNRDHRKITVIDGHTAFNGGINIADEYINETKKFGVWKDTGVMLKGDAVWNFTLMFLETWNAVSKEKIEPQDLVNYRPDVYSDNIYNTKGYVHPYPETPLDNEAVAENVYIDMLNQATDYVHILTPYLIIGENMKAALELAAKRGVDVCIVTPGVPDKKIVYLQTRSHYRELIEAGVRIFEYTPGFLHAKSFVSDDRIGIVGTINLDYRSLYLHFECGTLIMGTDTVMDLKNDTAETIAQSREVTLDDCPSGLIAALRDSVVRVVAPLM